VVSRGLPYFEPKGFIENPALETLDVTFAYFAPEVAFPLASALAAVVGFVMLVGRAPFRLAAQGFRYAARGLRFVMRLCLSPFWFAARGLRFIVGKLEI